MCSDPHVPAPLRKRFIVFQFLNRNSVCSDISAEQRTAIAMAGFNSSIGIQCVRTKVRNLVHYLVHFVSIPQSEFSVFGRDKKEAVCIGQHRFQFLNRNSVCSDAYRTATKASYQAVSIPQSEFSVFGHATCRIVVLVDNKSFNSSIGIQCVRTDSRAP